MRYICNPLNIEYHYQFYKPNVQGIVEEVPVQIAREAADPTMIEFKGKYYLFVSMNLGVWVSENMAEWSYYRLPDDLPLYDYAPDARVLGEYVYFSASSHELCDFYRTKDILNGPYEKIRGTFDFWDPNLFIDEDAKVYFYWGCANTTPIWGVELNPVTMEPLTERKELIRGDAWQKGYERLGEDHSVTPFTEEEIDVRYQKFLKQQGIKDAELTDEWRLKMRGYLSAHPYVEGAWMDKYEGRYYLQYACPGTEYPIYGDGVYVSDSPLGPFELAKNNPYSYKPGGFIPGAGHGSTMCDVEGNLWHTSTMSISVNHMFERRVGLWAAGVDADGELFCNQRYGDWPICVDRIKEEPWRNPDWYLLSYGKKISASSFEQGKEPQNAVDEDIHTWWRAAAATSGQWICLDLNEICNVYAVQINFADDKIEILVPGEIHGTSQARYIEENTLATRWILEGSVDGKNYFTLEDKSQVKTSLPHDLVVRENGVKIRFVKLTILEVPYQQNPCISGLRVFGVGNGMKPSTPVFTANRIGDLDMMVHMKADNATGYNILWGHTAEKLYHSYMVYGKEKQRIGALVKGQNYFVRVDAFNENGITEGICRRLE